MSVVTRIFKWIRSIFIKIKCYCSCQENVTDEVLEKYDNKLMKTFIFDKHTVQKKKEFKVSIK